jgi:hypothetical protein
MVLYRSTYVRLFLCKITVKLVVFLAVLDRCCLVLRRTGLFLYLCWTSTVLVDDWSYAVLVYAVLTCACLLDLRVHVV